GGQDQPLRPRRGGLAPRGGGREPGGAHQRAGLRRPRRADRAGERSRRADALLQAARGRRLPPRATDRPRRAERDRPPGRGGDALMADMVMPRLSDTMEEGTILRWLKRDGEEVRRGEELVEIETDKATMSYESDQEGVLQTVAGEGDTLAVGVIIARVGAARGGEHAHPASASPSAGSGRGPATGGPAGVRAVDGAAADGGSHPVSEPATGVRPGAARIKASPLARRVAHERGVDLGTVAGTGPGG